MLSALVSSLRLSLFASRRKIKLVRPRSATAYTHSPSRWRSGLRNAQGKKAKAPRKRPAKAAFDSPRWPSSCAQIEATSSSECRLRRRSEKNRSRLYGNAKAAAAGLLRSHTRGLEMFSFADTSATRRFRRSDGGFNNRSLPQHQTSPPQAQTTYAAISAPLNAHARQSSTSGMAAITTRKKRHQANLRVQLARA